MAIDLFVMPLSRYASGDYITPAMQIAWSIGAAYAIMTPEGRIDCPAGLPFGGAEAGDVRRKIVSQLPRLREALGQVTRDRMWDEEADGDIGNWRPSSSSFGAFLEQAERELTRRSLWERIRGRPEPTAQLLQATCFLPVSIKSPFVLTPPWARDEMLTGSLSVLANELARITPVEEAAEAHAMFTEAVEEAERRKLPLVVDM